MNDAASIPAPTPESRVHVYLAWACPFSHRVLAALQTTGLRDKVTVTWMRDVKGEAGWEIASGDDPLFGATLLDEVYAKLGEAGGTVPLMVDLSTQTVLSTSSAGIVRFLSRGMNGAHEVRRDLCPPRSEARIDAMNRWLHDEVNRAVYLVGFSQSQAEYEERVHGLFAALDALEERLAKRPFLLDDELTESDLWLLATLERFDSVYHPLFKCSVRRLADHPNLTRYRHHLRSIDRLHETFEHGRTKQHYYRSVMHVGGKTLDLNPTKLVPEDPRAGPWRTTVRPLP